jgi:hypothetical protein
MLGSMLRGAERLVSSGPTSALGFRVYIFAATIESLQSQKRLQLNHISFCLSQRRHLRLFVRISAFMLNLAYVAIPKNNVRRLKMAAVLSENHVSRRKLVWELQYG